MENFDLEPGGWCCSEFEDVQQLAWCEELEASLKNEADGGAAAAQCAFAVSELCEVSCQTHTELVPVTFPSSPSPAARRPPTLPPHYLVWVGSG